MPVKESKELLEALDAMKEEKSRENAERLTKLLNETQVLVPAVMPKNTDPAILKQMVAHPDTQMPIPKGAQPIPCILQNGEGKKFFPIFTSEEEITKGNGRPASPITLNMPFNSCMGLAVRIGDVDGAVINPYSHNIIININREEAGKKQKPEAIKLSGPEMHAFLRRQMEAAVLPGRIFKEGESFIKDLCGRQGACMAEFFEEPYEHAGGNPYSEDDYEFLTLMISDTLQLTRIAMPEKNLYPGTAQTLFVTWNPEEKKAGYYGILKAPRGEFDKLMEITHEGKAVDYGDAPSEGNELQCIIDIASGNRE